MKQINSKNIIIVLLIIIIVLILGNNYGGGLDIKNITKNNFLNNASTQKNVLSKDKILGLWVWRTSFLDKNSWKTLYNNTYQQDLLVEFTKSQNIGEIYLYIGSIQWDTNEYFSKKTLYNEEGLSRLLTQLNKNDIKVYGLFYINDKPNNLNNYKNSQFLVESVDAYNKRYPEAELAGIQLDQEPFEYEYYDDYFSLLSLLKKHTDSYNLKFQVVLKPLYTKINHKGTPFIEEVFKYTNDAILMDYFDNIDTIKKFADNSFYGNIHLGLETSYINVEDENTFYEEIEEKGTNWFYSKIVKSIDTIYASEEKYKGVSIHSYTSFFNFVHGKEPLYYIK